MAAARDRRPAGRAAGKPGRRHPERGRVVPVPALALARARLRARLCFVRGIPRAPVRRRRAPQTGSPEEAGRRSWKGIRSSSTSACPRRRWPRARRLARDACGTDALGPRPLSCCNFPPMRIGEGVRLVVVVDRTTAAKLSREMTSMGPSLQPGRARAQRHRLLPARRTTWTPPTCIEELERARAQAGGHAARRSNRRCRRRSATLLGSRDCSRSSGDEPGMPMLKTISGHTSGTRHLPLPHQEEPRALDRGPPQHRCPRPRGRGAPLRLGEASMDSTRRSCTATTFGLARQARAHLQALRRLARPERQRHTLDALRDARRRSGRASASPHYEVAIVCHDDNAERNPACSRGGEQHRTWRRAGACRTPTQRRSPRRSRGWRRSGGMSRARASRPEGRRRPRGEAQPARPGAEDAPQRARPSCGEGDTQAAGDYSWTADIRARVRVARAVSAQRGGVPGPPRRPHAGWTVSDNSPEGAAAGLGLTRSRSTPSRQRGRGAARAVVRPRAGSSRCCARGRHGAPVGRRREGGRRCGARGGGGGRPRGAARRSPRRSRSRSRRARRASTTWTPRRRTGARPPSLLTRGASACSPGSAPPPVGAARRRRRRSGTARCAPRGTTLPPSPEAGTGGKGGSGDDR